jgi:hypothetical protein
MKNKFSFFILLIQFFLWQSAYNQQNIDSIKFDLSLNFYSDLSDTYGGGNMLSGEFGVSKSWYGAKISYGHFESQSSYIFTVPLEESGYILEIPFDEMAIMKIGTMSLSLIPIKKKVFTTEIILGLSLAKARSLCLSGVEYHFDLIENRFTYLIKGYQLVKKTHFGYQAGLNITFFLYKKIGLQLNARLQDLNNGGTFFLIGGGLNFIL